jgi:hypothetical protein
MEKGQRIPKEETQSIEKYKELVHVSYQQNGYKDIRLELRILKEVYSKICANYIAEEPSAEFLLFQDSLTAHKAPEALKCVIFIYLFIHYYCYSYYYYHYYY